MGLIMLNYVCLAKKVPQIFVVMIRVRLKRKKLLVNSISLTFFAPCNQFGTHRNTVCRCKRLGILSHEDMGY